MKKYEVIFPESACWIFVGGFGVGCLWFGWGMHRILAPNTILFCGNSVSTPLRFLLEVGTPIGLIGALRLTWLACRGLANRWSALSSALLVIGGTAGLLTFGFRFFRGFQLSEIVWWLKPFGG